VPITNELATQAVPKGKAGWPRWHGFGLDAAGKGMLNPGIYRNRLDSAGFEAMAPAF
jgi:hypothetical protein